MSEQSSRSSGSGDIAQSTGTLWRALYHFNLYRLFLSGGLLTLSLTMLNTGQFGDRSPGLFLIASLGLAATSLINILTINSGKPSFRVQATWQVVSDILLLTLLLHSSGGIDSGFGFLLLVSIAGGGVVLPSTLTLGIAALATMSVMGEALVRHLFDQRVDDFQPVQLAVLGVACFATAIAMSFVSARVRRVENLAFRHAKELELLTQANAHIVQQLNTGVVLVAEDDRVLLTNEQSRRLLDLDAAVEGKTLESVRPELFELIQSWLHDRQLGLEAQALYPNGPMLIVRILAGPDSNDRGLVVLIEDESAQELRAQELKLAAIGRLTTAISHEIRNPLSALSHASELLADADTLSGPDRRLIEIIQTHSARINSVIQSVLHLGRRGPVDRRPMELLRWTKDFIDEVRVVRGLDIGDIEVIGSPIEVNVNADQLMQILTNLCDNAIRHHQKSAESDNGAKIWVKVGVSTEQRPVIEVIDGGPGVASDKISLLFEPFFTTESDGTGLGLYISRELAAANGATLNYVNEDGPGAKFRIEFPAPDTAKS